MINPKVLSVDGTLSPIGVGFTVFSARGCSPGKRYDVISETKWLLGIAKCLGYVESIWANGVLYKAYAFRTLSKTPLSGGYVRKAE